MAKKAAPKKAAKRASFRRVKATPQKHRVARGPKDIEGLEHEREALALRKAGASYRDIAARMGCQISSAHKMVRRAFERLEAEVDEKASEVIRLEVERLDDMLLGCWSAAKGGHLGAIDRALRISERRMRILGLERERLEHSGPDGGPIPVSTSYDRIKDKLLGYAAQLRQKAAEGAQG